jgi:hypothetical protein
VKQSCLLILGYAACAVLLVASVAGCGGGSASGNATIEGNATRRSSEPTRSSYIEESEALCKSVKKKAAPIHAELAELQGSIAGKAQEAKLITALKAYVALGREEAIDLRELGPPPVEARIASRWTAMATGGLDKLEQATEALEDGKVSRFNDLAKDGSKLLFESHHIARNHGFRLCGEEEGEPI